MTASQDVIWLSDVLTPLPRRSIGSEAVETLELEKLRCRMILDIMMGV